MKTKAQKEFLKQRRQYEKQLKEKAKNDELSLPEKLEWQQMSRNNYREKLFKDSKIDIPSLVIWRFWPHIFIVLTIIVGIIGRWISGLISPASDSTKYPDYSYEVIQEGRSTYVVNSSYNKVYHAILEISDSGNYLYDTYNEAQSTYETTDSFDIDTLYEIETFYYEPYDFLRDSLFSDLDELHQNILKLAKTEYSDIPLDSADLKTLKAAIETSKTNFDEEITLAMADLMKTTLSETK
ncbi:hypothetical protein QTL86_11795 [Cellulosilyticum sp. ST5]|uniref:hypothetical protein n=1 Tax=Cellulosilyticum sp. ST5 TaxID=3055805 RepID=UPI00397799AB